MLAYIVSSLLCVGIVIFRKERCFLFSSTLTDVCVAFAFVLCFFFVNCDVVDTYSGCKCVLIKTDPPSALIWYATTCHQSKLSSSIGSYFVDTRFDVMNSPSMLNGMENIVRRAAIGKI